jgi:hypothetical protein
MQTKLGNTQAEISGVSQTTSEEQHAAISSFVNGYRAFASSRLGHSLVLYQQTSELSRSVLSEIMLHMWQWAADVGLWNKGMATGAKVWKNGRAGTDVRSIR